jgi:hypothetical protein
MTKKDAEILLAKIYSDIFGIERIIDFDWFMQKYAYDVRLPVEVVDSSNGNASWISNMRNGKYISHDQIIHLSKEDSFMRPKIATPTIDQILATWQDTLVLASSHNTDCEQVEESDNIYRSSNVFRSSNILDSKGVVLSEYSNDCENVAAVRLSGLLQYCIRTTNSVRCSSSFETELSADISKSFYTYNCRDMYETMFCSNITGKKYCIANMQYEEKEYFEIKKMILNSLIEQ